MLDKLITQDMRIDKLIQHVNKEHVLSIPQIENYLNEIKEINQDVSVFVMDFEAITLKQSKQIEVFKSMWESIRKDNQGLEINLRITEQICRSFEYKNRELSKELATIKAHHQTIKQDGINEF